MVVLWSEGCSYRAIAEALRTDWLGLNHEGMRMSSDNRNCPPGDTRN
jgi:hypothetical protein